MPARIQELLQPNRSRVHVHSRKDGYKCKCEFSSLDSVSAENCSSAVDSVSSEPKSENGGVRTILNTLKSPALSQLARKRKIHSNPPTSVKRRTTTVKADYEPKSVTPTSRPVSFLESI